MAVLKAGEPPIEHEKELPMSVTEYKTLPEQIAKSKVFVKNWYIPEFREKYAQHDRMKRCDFMFPYARLKAASDHKQPLLIDIPKNEYELEVCLLKAKQMKKLGYKYCYLEEDSSLFDALSQLGET